MEINTIDSRYEIRTKIGSGGYASVYLAYDRISKQFVAVKILKCDINENIKTYNMFKQEAMTMAALTNQNIVKVFSSGIYKNNPYMVMEYVKGKSLKEIILENGYLLVNEVFAYMKQILNGLKACHEANIIHRDIKPQNIIKKADGILVLIDFGTAFIAEDEKNLYKEDGSSIVVTVQYMAPELIQNPTGSIQSDIYAIGISMYEMFTGKYPFNPKNGNDKTEVVKMHLQTPFPSVRKVNPTVPIAFENIIYKCCQKDPDKRYKNISELELDLFTAYEEYKNPKEKKVPFFKKIFQRRKK